MPCYSPLKAWPVGYHDSGKTKYKITSYTTDFVKEAFAPATEIPCGRCIGCRLKYSRQWADRCMLELKNHEQSWFVTLTYEDDYLPHKVDAETGEVYPTATLDKRDFQLFMKRLRKAYQYDNKISYFCAGEYGSQTFRPHYHAILFGLKLDDLKLYKRSLDGYNYYNSDFLNKVWKKGHVVVGQANWDTCAYTARYILKKQYGSQKQFYEDYHIDSEFTLISTKPAIGRQYFDENWQTIFDSDFIFIGTEETSYKIKPPKYYERLFEVLDPERSEALKIQNKEIMEDNRRLKLEKTSLPYLEYLCTEQENKLAQISSLKRKEF